MSISPAAPRSLRFTRNHEAEDVRKARQHHRLRYRPCPTCSDRSGWPWKRIRPAPFDTTTRRGTSEISAFGEDARDDPGLGITASVKLMKPALATSALTTSGERAAPPAATRQDHRVRIALSGLASCRARLEAVVAVARLLGLPSTIGVSISSRATSFHAWRSRSASRGFLDRRSQTRVRNPQIIQNGPDIPDARHGDPCLHEKNSAFVATHHDAALPEEVKPHRGAAQSEYAGPQTLRPLALTIVRFRWRAYSPLGLARAFGLRGAARTLPRTVRGRPARRGGNTARNPRAVVGIEPFARSRNTFEFGIAGSATHRTDRPASAGGTPPN